MRLIQVVDSEVFVATAYQTMKQTRAQIKRIAVLTDFSQNAENALRLAATIARGYKASIALAHAYLPPSSAFAAPEVKLVYQALETRRRDLEDQLLAATEADFLRDINCVGILREGSPTELLKELNHPDLIVVGTSGGTGWEKAALGSTAETIFRSSSVPVLTVGPHCRGSGTESLALDTVLYATDFSVGAAGALPCALSIAREHGAKLVLLHVRSDKDVLLSFKRPMATAGPLEKLHKLVPSELDLEYRPTYVVRFGKPEDVIIEEAKHCGAKIIVIGVQRINALASVVSHFAGGTAYGVAVNADCPVLTIRNT
jgi:nucleotide-binding universal stress UspA family protein